METWKPINEYEGYYEISSHGRVKSLSRSILRSNGRVQSFKERTLSEYHAKITERYISSYVHLYRDGVGKPLKVSRLVAIAFLGNPPTDKHECCHNNGNPLDNRVSNLRWDTRSANQLDRILHGTSNRGEKCASSKLTLAQVLEIRSMRDVLAMKYSDISKFFTINERSVRQICIRERWAHV